MDPANYLVVIHGYEGIEHILGFFTKDRAYLLAKKMKINPIKYRLVSSKISNKYGYDSEEYEIEAKKLDDQLIREAKEIFSEELKNIFTWKPDQVCIMPTNLDDPLEIVCVCNKIDEE